MNHVDLLAAARQLIRAEAAAIASVADQLGDSFVQAVELVAVCSGSVYVTGAGTSAAMAKRFAHLLATCGIAAFFISTGDALHGESALAKPGDILVALSKAGRSQDLNMFAQIARERGAMVISFTSELQSQLAQLSDIVIIIQTDNQAEGEDLLPFGSTLAHGAVGDAITLLVKRLQGFNLAELARTHPLGGANELAKGKPS
jgi:arabinose-5-phosphate isomerase